MKKIFAIIMMIVMVFSMSVTAFGGFIVAPKVEGTKPETVTVTVALKNGCTRVGKDELLESQIIEWKDHKEIRGRIFELNFIITNDTKSVIVANDVLKGFEVSVTDATTEKTVQCWTKAKDNGFGEKDLSKIAISPDDPTKVISYKIYAITNKSVTIEAIYGEETKDVEKDATFVLISEPTITTTTTTTTTPTTTTEATEPKATETEVSTTEETYTTETPTTVSEVYDYDYVTPIEDEIPATGSHGVALTVFGSLGITAVAAAMVTKKKKH